MKCELKERFGASKAFEVGASLKLRPLGVGRGHLPNREKRRAIAVQGCISDFMHNEAWSIEN